MGFELVHEFAIVGTTCFVVALHLLSEQLDWFSEGHGKEFTYTNMVYSLLSYGALFTIVSVLLAYLTTSLSTASVVVTLSGFSLAAVLGAVSQASSQRAVWLACRAAGFMLIGSTVLFYWPW